MNHRFGDGIIGDCVYHADFQRALRGDFLGGNEHLKRSSLPYEARQPLCPSPTRDQAQSGATMAKHRRGRGDPAMTGEG